MKDISNKAKLIIILKLVVFNTFFVGFILNFLPYTNANWISNDNYVFGLFQYCKKVVEVSEIQHAAFYRSIHPSAKSLRNISSKMTKSRNESFIEEFRCFNWNNLNKPKFIQRSLAILSFALLFHLLTIILIISSTLFQSNTCNRSIFDFLRKKMDDNPYDNNHSKLQIFALISKLKVKDTFDYTICLLGLINSGLYGSNLIIFSLNQAFSSLSGKREELSWCFWISSTGSSMTIISTCLFSIKTFYFDSFDCNEDDPSLFVNHRGNHLSPNSIAALSNTTIAAESVYNIDFINKKSLIPISIALKNQEKVTPIKTDDHQIKIGIKQVRCSSFKKLGKEKAAKKDFCPSSKIYSQVFPKERNHHRIVEGDKQAEKKDHSKMVALPYGTLSGTTKTAKDLHDQTTFNT